MYYIASDWLWSMLCAATVEIVRLHYATNKDYTGYSICIQQLNVTTHPAVDMSILC